MQKRKVFGEKNVRECLSMFNGGVKNPFLDEKKRKHCSETQTKHVLMNQMNFRELKFLEINQIGTIFFHSRLAV